MKTELTFIYCCQRRQTYEPDLYIKLNYILEEVISSTCLEDRESVVTRSRYKSTELTADLLHIYYDI